MYVACVLTRSWFVCLLGISDLCLLPVGHETGDTPFVLFLFLQARVCDTYLQCIRVCCGVESMV